MSLELMSNHRPIWSARSRLEDLSVDLTRACCPMADAWPEAGADAVVGAGSVVRMCFCAVFCRQQHGP